MRKMEIAVACGVLLAGCLRASVAGAQQVQVSPNNRTIAVTTSDDAERRADTATVHIGYQLYGPISAAVTETAAQASKAIVAAEKQLGIAEGAIESDGQSTGPVQDFQDNGLSPQEKANRRFQAQQSWTVKTTADGAAKVLAVAVAAGANQSGAIDWSVADEASLSAEAAGKALKHARELAAQMAAGLSSKVGLLLYASNQSESVRVMPMMARKGLLGGMGSEPAAVTLSLSPPMVSRSATVSAVFALE